MRSTNDAYQAGVVFGHPRFGSSEWLSFRIKRNQEEGRVACLARQFTWPDRAVPVDLRNPNHFELRCQGGRITATANGIVVERDAQPKTGLVRDNDLLVGFGGYLNTNEFTVRYRNVRLQRLRSSAEAPGTPGPAVVP